MLELDARGYETNQVNSLVINAFDSLPVGEKMLLVNDLDPYHVVEELEEKRFGKYEWEYIQEGPDEWKLSLAKKYMNYI